VGPSKRADADIDYTFVSIGVKNGDVDYSSNCGNMTSAVGPFAVDSGIVKTGPTNLATIRIHNTNTGKIIHSTFPIANGEAVADGAFSIDGVAGTASQIKLDFVNPAGSKTNKLLPTGNVVDIIDNVRVSCVDVGNPCVFVLAKELQIDGTMLPDAIEAHSTLLNKLEHIRGQAAVKMGICETPDRVPGSIPKIAFVSPRLDYTMLSGSTISSKSIDIVARAISVGQPHRAVPITLALAIATATKIPGSTVQECIEQATVDRDGITVGHPSGKIMVEAVFDAKGTLQSASVFRTARRLMEGRVFWK
jgi:2-methylaconitate cis-trans-isomerase PrpF